MAEINELCIQIKDHEDLLRSLERNQLEMKYNLLSIENGQKDIKLLIVDVNKNQSELLNKFVTCTLDGNKTDETIKLTNNKNIWSLIF